jgi:hypothetical protein
MTNQALFSEIVKFVSQSDSRPYDMKLQVNYTCDIWDSRVVEMRSFMSDNLGQIQVYLIGSEKWSTAHNLSPRDSGVIYGLLLAKWLGWDKTPKTFQL